MHGMSRHTVLTMLWAGSLSTSPTSSSSLHWSLQPLRESSRSCSRTEKRIVDRHLGVAWDGRVHYGDDGGSSLLYQSLYTDDPLAYIGRYIDDPLE